MGSVNAIRRDYERYGIRATSVFPAGTFPQVPIDDPKMYPIYATCVELGIPIFVCAGIPGPRVPFAPQEVSRIDVVMFDFPDLVFITRHGCEPWEDLAVKLMLKWPNLYYSTSAFAPKYYPKAIIDYANSRGADKVLYAGYFPMGLSLERIFSELPKVPLRDEVWPKFLYGNAARILGLEG
jgi:predicted TIM-barrel fold metal-dependent hydrolase